MIIATPISINDSVLTSSSIPENEGPEWDVGTTYNLDDIVKVTEVDGVAYHRYYRSTGTQGGSFPPEQNTPLLPGGQPWEDLGPTNRYKMFDGAKGTLSVKADSVVIEVTPGIVINTVAGLNIQSDSVNVTMTDPTDGVVRNQDIDLLDLSGVIDEYTWFFSPLAKKKNFAVTNLPAYPDATTKITFTNTGENVLVGELIFSYGKDIGTAIYPFTPGTIDYSQQVTDEVTGENSLEIGGFKFFNDYNVFFKSNRTSFVRKTLIEARGKISLFVGNDNIEESIIYGWPSDWSIEEKGTEESMLTLEVTELS